MSAGLNCKYEYRSEEMNYNFLNCSYFTEACSHGFQCLYDNTSGAIESMSNFWRLVATTFKNYSNVFG